MAKKKKTNSYTKQNSGSPFMFVVIVLVIIMGIGTLFALGGGANSGGGVSTAGGQSVGSLESQVTSLTQQATANPKNFSIHDQLGTTLFNLANSYRQSNNPKANETMAKAIKVFNETLQLNPNSKETLGDLATAYFYSNQVDQAISTVQKALKIDPSFVPALMNYGIYLADGKGDYASAIQQWEKVPAGTDQYSEAQSFIEKYKQQAGKTLK